LAEGLLSGGLRLVSGGTDNHLLLVDVTPLGLGGKKAEAALGACGITVNKNMIPYDEQKPVDPSGIRIGTPAVTTRGMGTSEMRRIAGWILKSLKEPDNARLHRTIRSEVFDLCMQFPVPASRLAEVDSEQLEKLAIDVSDALQRKLVPQIARHIRGDAAIFIADYFSKLAPRAWSLSGYDQALCAPVIAAVPANATVRGFRYRAWDKNRGEMDCAAGSLECAIGHSRFLKGCASRPAETSMDGITLYTAIFQNWSTDRAREGRLIIFFELPTGQVPVSQI
jgi:hypothetical protein